MMRKVIIGGFMGLRFFTFILWVMLACSAQTCYSQAKHTPKLDNFPGGSKIKITQYRLAILSSFYCVWIVVGNAIATREDLVWIVTWSLPNVAFAVGLLFNVLDQVKAMPRPLDTCGTANSFPIYLALNATNPTHSDGDGNDVPSSPHYFCVNFRDTWRMSIAGLVLTFGAIAVAIYQALTRDEGRSDDWPAGVRRWVRPFALVAQIMCAPVRFVWRCYRRTPGIIAGPIRLLFFLLGPALGPPLKWIFKPRPWSRWFFGGPMNKSNRHPSPWKLYKMRRATKKLDKERQATKADALAMQHGTPMLTKPDAAFTNARSSPSPEPDLEQQSEEPNKFNLERIFSRYSYLNSPVRPKKTCTPFEQLVDCIFANDDVFYSVIPYLHAQDFKTLAITSRSLRATTIRRFQHTLPVMSLDSLSRYLCGGSSERCYACNQQVCATCQQLQSIATHPLQWQRENLHPICNKCYFGALCFPRHVFQSISTKCSCWRSGRRDMHTLCKGCSLSATKGGSALRALEEQSYKRQQKRFKVEIASGQQPRARSHCAHCGDKFWRWSWQWWKCRLCQQENTNILFNKTLSAS